MSDSGERITSKVSLLSSISIYRSNALRLDGFAEHGTPPHCNTVMLNPKSAGVRRQSESASILGGVGWNGVEWVWRGHTSGTIGAFSG